MYSKSFLIASALAAVPFAAALFTKETDLKALELSQITTGGYTASLILTAAEQHYETAKLAMRLMNNVAEFIREDGQSQGARDQFNDILIPATNVLAREADILKALYETDRVLSNTEEIHEQHKKELKLIGDFVSMARETDQRLRQQVQDEDLGPEQPPLAEDVQVQFQAPNVPEQPLGRSGSEMVDNTFPVQENGMEEEA